MSENILAEEGIEMKRTGFVFVIMLAGLISGCNNNTISEQTQAQNTAAVETQTAALTEATAQSEGTMFSDLDIEVSEGTIRVRSGEEFSLTRRDGKAMDYELSDGVLHVRAGRSDEILLVLPETDSYETMELLVKNGHAYVEDSVTVDSLVLQVTQGEASLDGISVLTDCSLRVDSGSASLYGDMGVSVTADCRQGHLALSMPVKETDYNYEIELSGGSVSLGSHHYDGKSASRTVDNGGARSMKLSCTHGNLSVQFH